MTVKLVCLDPVATNAEFLLDSLPVCIGRSPDAEIQIHDSWASRFHCEIGESDGTLVVRDLGSSNGTLINGRSISEAPLLPGDELTVGISTFLANYRGEEVAMPHDVLSGLNWDSGTSLCGVRNMLLYGGRLRLLEALRMRVKDLDFERGEITVREGQGDKDRVTTMPRAVVKHLQEHLQRVKTIHQQHVADGYGRVELPHALTRKYPKANQE